MAISLQQSATAVAPNITASFLAAGGTAPYVYSVRSGGAGGSINSSTGVYQAPASMSEDPATIYDIIQVRDNVGAIATASILVGNALLLVCDIIQNQMNLPPGRVYLWDQKLFQPSDQNLYVAVSMMTCHPFGNNISYDGSGGGLIAKQSVNMAATIDIDIISRGPAARDQKELVLMALQSTYSEQQQEANSFQISRLPAGGRFINLSDIDGDAIPYRYKISMNLQYAVTNNVAVSYYNTFSSPSVATNP